MRDSIKIGCSAILNGHEAVHGRAIVNAVGLAIEQANQQDRLPCKLELVAENDRDEYEAARQVARQFIRNESLLGVVGPMNSHAAFAAAPLYSKAGMVHISPAASNPKLTRKGFSTFYRMIAHDEYQGRRAAEFARSYLNLKRMAIIHDGSTFGKPLARVFEIRSTELGANIVTSREIRRGQVDFVMLAQDMAAIQPEIIFFGVIEEEGLRLAPQLRQAGVRSVFMGTDGLKASRYLETPEAGVLGPYYSNASTDVKLQPSALGFKKAFGRRYNTPYSVYSAEAYDAAGILIHAIQNAKPLSRRSVLKNIAGLANYMGITGSIVFDKYGDRLNPTIGFYEQVSGAINFLGFDAELCQGRSSQPQTEGKHS